MCQPWKGFWAAAAKPLTLNFNAVNSANGADPIPGVVVTLSLDGGVPFTPLVGTNYLATGSVVLSYSSPAQNYAGSLAESLTQGTISPFTVELDSTSNFVVSAGSSSAPLRLQNYGWRTELDIDVTNPVTPFYQKNFSTNNILNFGAVYIRPNINGAGSVGAISIVQSIFFDVF